jgi:hypothetical protein
MSTIKTFFEWIMTIDWTPEAITAASTVALAFLTFILAIGTLFLWKATKRLVKGSEKTAERQLRAYVTANNGGFETKNGFVTSVIIKNVGQTPAYKVKVASITRVLSHPIYRDFDFTFSMGDHPSSLTLGRDDLVRHPSPLNTIVSQEQFDDFAYPNGTSRIYTYGRITYEDIFKVEQYTNFCFFIEWSETEAWANIIMMQVEHKSLFIRWIIWSALFKPTHYPRRQMQASRCVKARKPKTALGLL